MRVVVVYREQSEHSRAVREFVHDYENRTGHKIETIDPDSVAGESFCRAYDITSYPTLVAVTDNNIMQQMWPGLPLPTIMEVSYYA